jgi:hypothetical protein
MKTPHIARGGGDMSKKFLDIFFREYVKAYHIFIKYVIQLQYDYPAAKNTRILKSTLRLIR